METYHVLIGLDRLDPTTLMHPGIGLVHTSRRAGRRDTQRVA